MQAELAASQGALASIANACAELKASQCLKKVMLLVLDLGNSLNLGRAKGIAEAFDFETLGKLKDTRVCICPQDHLSPRAAVLQRRGVPADVCALGLGAALLQDAFHVLVLGFYSEAALPFKYQSVHCKQAWLRCHVCSEVPNWR